MTLDFTQPSTLHKLAALPFYGYAEALVRRIDPYWHAPEPPYTYRVVVFRSERCCSCGQDKEESKTLLIEAHDADEAEDIARLENKGWYVGTVQHPKFPSADIPKHFLAQFETAA